MSSVGKLMANSLSIKRGLSFWCPQSASLTRLHHLPPASVSYRSFRRNYVLSSASFANENREFGGGNAAGYAAKTFVENGMADGRLYIVSKEVDGQFRTGVPGIFAIGDVADFPLKIYDRVARVEHVDHARRSSQHCIKILTSQTHTYDYLPYFYSRVFEYEGSPRKVWWQFFGDNVGETIEIGNFDPKIATFWVDAGKLKGFFLESGSPEEFQLLPKLARGQALVDKAKLQSASSVEEALDITRSALLVKAAV